jgi:uncharacterized protein (DUF1015 family)
MLAKMADVRPFRALRYDSELDLSPVVCPPFDTISTDLQHQLYERSPYNAVRIELAEETGPGRYENAARTLREWMAEGILRRDERPAFYLHRQTFQHDGREYTRTMLFARLRVVPWDEGSVLPHEQTFGGPKEDRIQLMRAAHINGSPVFLFYRDRDGRVSELLTAASPAGTKLADFAEPNGQKHSVRRLDDPATVQALAQAFAEETLYIADGHHRFETALAYRDEAKASASQWTGEEPENFAMAALVAYDDPGMLVLPTHRLCNAAAPWAEVRARLAPLFGLEPFVGGAVALETAIVKRAAIGLVAAGAGSFIATVRDCDAVDRLMPAERSAQWRALDYAVANHVIMRHALGLTDADMHDRSQVWFCEDAAEAAREVESGRARYAVLLKAAPVATVLALADGGEKMPQKSTFFWPKAPTGVVFNLLED